MVSSKNWPAKGEEGHSIAGPGNKISCAPEYLSRRATTAEPSGLKAVLGNKRNLGNEKPAHLNWRKPSGSQDEPEPTVKTQGSQE